MQKLSHRKATHQVGGVIVKSGSLGPKLMLLTKMLLLVIFRIVLSCTMVLYT